MKTKCPSCNHDYEVEAGTVVPESQTLTLSLGYDSELICARSLGKAILSMEQIQRSVAKEIGFNVTVFIKAIVTEPKKLTVEFVIAKNYRDG